MAAKNFPDFVCRRQGDSLIWLEERFATPADVALIANPDELFRGPGCDIIKDQRKIKVARLRINLGGESRVLYLKRYNAFSWRVLLSSWFRPSGAVSALRGAAILWKARIPTARPVAAVESRVWGMATKSFFFSEEIAGGETVDRYWRHGLSALNDRERFRRRREFLQALASMFRSLHDQSVYHGDLKDANILVVPGRGRGEDRFFLLDLEVIRRYARLSQRRRVKNLVQLNRTLGQYLRRTDKLVFLREYLAEAFSHRRLKRHWVGRILRRSASVDRRKLAAPRSLVRPS